jgi:hypothetical protein
MRFLNRKLLLSKPLLCHSFPWRLIVDRIASVFLSPTLDWFLFFFLVFFFFFFFFFFLKKNGFIIIDTILERLILFSFVPSHVYTFTSEPEDRLDAFFYHQLFFRDHGCISSLLQ